MKGQMQTTLQHFSTRHRQLKVAGRRTVMHLIWRFVVGGSEVYALKLASNLEKEKYLSIICALDAGGVLEDEANAQGILTYVMNRRRGIDLGLFWRLYRLFRKQRVDIVHTHHFTQLFYSLPGALLVRARIIHTEHGLTVYRKRHLRVAFRFLSFFCDKVVTIGQDCSNVLNTEFGIPERKLAVAHAGIDLSSFEVSKEQARLELGISPDARVATIVAQLYPVKNHSLLLSAFKEVIPRIPTALLLVVGDGVERENMVLTIELLGLHDNVRMLGQRRDIPRILAASDTFVLSSDSEGLPIAMLEAMAAGKPVVATAVNDIPTVVVDRESGRIVPPRDPQALADALVELLNNSNLAEEMGEKGRSIVDQRFSVRAMVSKHEALYG